MLQHGPSMCPSRRKLSPNSHQQQMIIYLGFVAWLPVASVTVCRVHEI